MTVSTAISMALAKCGMSRANLAVYMGMTPSALGNKTSRQSWTAKDLVAVARATGAQLHFVYPDGQVIIIDEEDQKAEPEA